jgi:hypothetical protein
MSNAYNSFTADEPPEPYVLDLYKQRDEAWEKIDRYEETIKSLFILLNKNNIPVPENLKSVYNDLFIWGCWKSTIKNKFKDFFNSVNKQET